jgi:hypothetical protein
MLGKVNTKKAFRDRDQQLRLDVHRMTLIVGDFFSNADRRGLK